MRKRAAVCECQECGGKFTAYSPVAVCGDCKIKALYGGQTWEQRVEQWAGVRPVAAEGK